MGRTRRDADALASHSARPARILAAPVQAVDPVLASLFASSSGPVKISRPQVSSATNRLVAGQKFQTTQRREDASEQSDDATSSSESNIEAKSDSAELSDESAAEEDTHDVQRSRKRRRIQQTEDLERSYLDRLAREEAKEEVQRQALQQVSNGRVQQQKESSVSPGISGQHEHSALSALSEQEDIPVPQHETMASLDASATLSKAARTVFLGNISTAAIKSKSAKKVLLAHLASPLHALRKSDPPPKVESLRFRSTAFASGVGPKKAAFAKKELMEDTTASTNAYVVYSSEAAARECALRLNGSIVLDRHVRADYAAHPAGIDHRRCIFVGNLSFVDKENVENLNDGAHGKPRRPKAKEPADAEEGLWRTFSRAGTVESVRVVRDKETRVGKGFAYIQFKDENSVEAALLYNDKKFPPMLPRKLRVMRAKRPNPATTRRSSDDGSRAFKTKGRSARDSSRGNRPSFTSTPSGAGRPGNARRPNGVVFEGHRATSFRGSQPGGFKAKKRRPVKLSTRSSRRAAAFKAAGGKRKRES